MSSVDIAKMTGKRHDHVMRDINVMLENMESKGVPKSEDTHMSTYTHEQNGLAVNMTPHNVAGGE